MLKSVDLRDIINIAKEAGEAAMSIYKKDFEVCYKEDESPLTKADLKANKIILSGLKKLYPSVPLISEESKTEPFEVRKHWEYYWCIDPIDGTKEFVKKSDEFTINIALMHKNKPVLGVVYAPALTLLYAAKKNEGAHKYENGTKKVLLKEKLKSKRLNVATSKSHLDSKTEEFIKSLLSSYTINQTAIGSSLKICLIAEGKMDLYPRCGKTMEWDTAAAHAVLKEAGKDIYVYSEKISSLAYIEKNINLKSLKYNKKDLTNPYFIAI
ncbi:MAG: 3'(2'),5'-bisphosphate nucleotidase CysQ [Campylobacteraceae bacterium]|nr:3'(2'),5'-bisphosphate nucleotidase CysQ [Campylobacteraceae bacterium]